MASPPPPQPDKRRRGRPRSDATRDAIVAAAIALFAERGFAAVSTRDIAAAVGVASPSLYRHFASLEEIVAAAVRRVSTRRAEMYRAAIAAAAPDAAARMKAVAVAAIANFLDDPVALGFYQHLFAPGAERPRAIAEAMWRADPYPEILAVIVAARADPPADDGDDPATVYALLFAFALGIAIYGETAGGTAPRNPVRLAERALQMALPATDWRRVAPLACGGASA